MPNALRASVLALLRRYAVTAGRSCPHHLRQRVFEGMSPAEITRRDFLADSSRTAAASVFALSLPWLATLAGCATDTNQFTQLTPAEGRAMQAFAAQIVPSDDGAPGAEEAGAVYFVDRALGEPYFATSVPVVRAGLADLETRARSIAGGKEFASLSKAQQITVMQQIEREPFFTIARTLVVIGTFADPSHGGNRNGVGWEMIGMEHRPAFTAPFGWYDALPTSQTITKGT